MLTLEQCITVLESIDGLVVTDDKGIILFFDKRTAEGIGTKPEECIGRYIKDILPLTKIDTVLKTKQHNIGEFYFINDQKHWQHPVVVSTIHPMYEGDEFKGVIEYDLFYSYNVLKQFLKTSESLINELTLYKNKNKSDGAYAIDALVGSSQVMEQLRKQIFKAANSQSTVVITGETGSGKELVARAIHGLSKRKNHAFVPINCASIPNELFESELFGYEEGSFTGAKKGGKIGKFELADKGTFFLDEINSLSLNMQPKLLRALQEKEIDRIGGKTSIPIDSRIICASNQSLNELVKSGKFREDLYFRLNVIPIKIPPLRERLSDIEELVYASIDNLNLLLGRNIKKVDSDVIELLHQYDWPGNVRELQNILERALNDTEVNEDTLQLKHIPQFLSKKEKVILQVDNPIKMAQDAAEKEVILYALKQAKGNKTEAAKLLKIARPVLYRKLQRLKIEATDFTKL